MANSAVEQIKVSIVDVAEQPSLSPESHDHAAQAGGQALQVRPRRLGGWARIGLLESKPLIYGSSTALPM